MGPRSREFVRWRGFFGGEGLKEDWWDSWFEVEAVGSGDLGVWRGVGVLSS